MLGLVILRGDLIVSISVAAPPPASANPVHATAAPVLPGPGSGKPAGRGLPVAAPGHAVPGLGGPVRGIGMGAMPPPPPGMMGAMPPPPGII